MAMAARVASSSSPVLITGESGTGKELVARAIHHQSDRGSGQLVDVGCAAIGGTSVETELFGSEGGAGAIAPRAGLLELAAGGTLFMDEISALDPRLQGAMLRVLEQGSFLRVGGMQKVAMSARLITATNRDIDALVADGSFRNDLFYRINTIRLVLPPLRERRCDIPVIAQHFLQRYGGATPPTLRDDALAALVAYDWPGNVRELRNVIERAVLLATGGEISVAELPFSAADASRRRTGSDGRALVSLATMEREHMHLVLERSGWHQGRAATILGVSSKTLYRKIREFGFQRPNDP
jgi:DNA-binding NtrC family response regulator